MTLETDAPVYRIHHDVSGTYSIERGEMKFEYLGFVGRAVSLADAQMIVEELTRLAEQARPAKTEEATR